MKVYDLKTDNKLPHHYLIGVIMHPITAGKLAGQRALKYGPLYFHNDDVDKLRDALMISQDKLFPTSQQEALDMHGIRGLVQAISAMKLACSVNLGTMHHFSSAEEMDEDAFLFVIDLANTSKEGRKLLDDSKIGSSI